MKTNRAVPWRGWLKGIVVLGVCAGVVVAVGCPASSGTGTWQAQKNKNVAVADAPALAADGTTLVYASLCTGGGDIYRIEAGTSEPVRLTASEDYESSPLISADGTRIVYAREREGRRQIWMMGADGGGARALTEGDRWDEPVALAREGGLLLFRRSWWGGGLGKSSMLCVLRLDAEDAEPVEVGQSAAMGVDAAVVVARDAEGMWRWEFGGGEARREKLEIEGSVLDVSRDGRRLLVERSAAGASWSDDREIWLVDIEAGDEKQIAAGTVALLLGRDGDRVVYFANGGRNAYVVSISEGMRQQIDGLLTSHTLPRATWDRRGAIVGTYDTRGAGWTAFDVLYVDASAGRGELMGTLSCGGGWIRGRKTGGDARE